MASEPLMFPKGRPPGGGGSDMEARVARLESDVEYIRRDVSELKIDVRDLKNDMIKVKIDVAVLTERVAHLPTKGYLIATASGIIALLTAAMLFADKIKAALHLAP